MTSNEKVVLLVSRRSLATAALAPLIVPRHVLGRGYQAPSDTSAIAAVGIGGMGRNYIAGCKGERIVALCDMDHTRDTTIQVFNTYPAATRYRDYRQMFDKESKNFDALIIAVPDHQHTILLMTAIHMDKHIYCAKPITHSVGEGRKVMAALRQKPKLITKGSVQDSATTYSRATAELLASGVIGPVREVHITCSHPIYPCSQLRPTAPETPPEGMDWDLWIGPAPYRPFFAAHHPFNWRPWWDFGSGTVADMLCHTMHTYFNELQLGAPKTIYACGSTVLLPGPLPGTERTGGTRRPSATPECQGPANMVTWDDPASGSMPPLQVHWYDGGMKPHRPAELDHRVPMLRDSVLFVGEKGKLLTDFYGGNPLTPFPGRTVNAVSAALPPSVSIHALPGGVLLPQEDFRDAKQPAATLRRVEKADHYTEWTKACKTGQRTVLPVEFACQMTEVALLGTIALRTGKLLEWDSAAAKIVNDDEANALVDIPYRKGWSAY